MSEDTKKQWIVFGCGVVLFGCATGLSIEYRLHALVAFILFLMAYMLLGFSVFRRVVKNFENRQYFNENVLIVLATAGAIGIGKYIEGCAVILLFALAGIAEDMTVRRSKKYIGDFVDIRPVTAVRKVRGKEFKVDPATLRPLHTVVVKPGERVPVDGVITAGSTTLDVRALTGETIPQTAILGDRVYSGSINLTGAIEIRVTKTYQESTVSQIMQMGEDAGREDLDKKTPVSRFMHYYTPIVVLLGLLIMIVPPLTFAWSHWHDWLYRGMVFLVAACPCGLLISEPLAFLGGIAAAAKHGVIVKGGHFLQYLFESDVFIFDKTGTLTEGVFEVTEVHPEGITADELLKMAAYAECYSNHPVAKSLLKAYGETIDKKQIRSVKETAGLGIRATVEGRKVYIGNRRMAQKQGVDYAQVESAGTVLHVVIDGKYVGYIIAEDIIKDEAYGTVDWLRNKWNAVVVMLTGDRRAAAAQTAYDLDMDYAYAELLPQQKLEYLKEFMFLQGENEKVAFVGDGINDAMVLSAADVGIAMGALGSDAAIQAADIVLMEDDVSRIIDVIRLSKETTSVVRSNLWLAVLVKVVVLILAACGMMSLWVALAADLVVMFTSLVNAVSVVKYPLD